MTSDTSFGPDQMEEGVHAWTSPCNPDPMKPGVKLMAGCNSAGVGVTSVSLPVVNSYVSKTCDKGVVMYGCLIGVVWCPLVRNSEGTLDTMISHMFVI